MKGFELLGQLLEALKEGEVKGEFRQALEPRPALRAIAGPVAVGRVLGETESGDGRVVKLGFTVYVPHGAGPEAAESALDFLIQRAKSAAELSEVERGAIAQDKLTGLLAVECRFVFRWNAGGEAADRLLQIVIGDRKASVKGWKLGVNRTGEALTAIGEDLPFARSAGREYVLELEGLEEKILNELPSQEDMEVVLPEGGGRLAGCRWKSLSSGGKAVLSGKSWVPA